ncbi:DUF3443 domain-containing protein [Paraburkholderia hayleyella]|uniref:DUF3443 domain-containing protein n=1 Tax=Paraburkholderia hayleyella TaxID=2152889 RepID=UPI001290DDE2|nr:DUF3443 domain-containing protein [Paraburkholderia hayleyella]
MLFTTHFKQFASVLSCVALLSLAACGSSESTGLGDSQDGINSLPAGPTMQPVAATASNTVPITVNAGSAKNINVPMVSVTVCASGSTSDCQTIDNILLDTGSDGLRVMSSALNSSLSAALPHATSEAGPLAQCANFASGYMWGTVRTVDVKIGGETASGIPIQVVGDLPESSVPENGCANGPAVKTAKDLGANGILGMGTRYNDCGEKCLSESDSEYYACDEGAECAQAAVPLAQQLSNPVRHFAVNNNGMILQLPPVPNRGAASVTGTLVFGINTQPNNALNATTQLYTNGVGNLPGSLFNGKQVNAFFDSGAYVNFFTDDSLTKCSGKEADFYCPAKPQTRSVTLVGQNGTTGNVSFNVASASTLFKQGANVAFNNLAGPSGADKLDWFALGLPFFFGRHVYFGMDQSDTPDGKGPYVAF